MLRLRSIALLAVVVCLGCDPAIDVSAVRRGNMDRPQSDGAVGDASPGNKPEPNAGGCGAIDYLGTCVGHKAQWCEAGVLKETDCALRGQECGYVDDTVGYYCKAPGGAVPSDAGTATDATNPAAEGCGRPVETEEFELTNMERMRGGLTPYTCDDGLTRAARAHAQDMCDNNYFSHTSQDGRSHIDRIRAAGVMFDQGGENIAWGQQSPEEVNRTWMNSGGHRAAIMSNGFRRIGVGYVECDGRPHWVQDFAD